MIKGKQNEKLLILAIASGTMINPLNSSMISLAIHRVQHDFHLSFSSTLWLISSFYLASAVTQPISGKIGDLVGRKRLFLLGLILVFLSALFAPISSTFMFLIFMRLIQAIGSSAIYPSGVALIRSHIHHNQASALAVLSIFSSTMTALGPSVGGFLISYGDWPAIFYVNFPIIIISFIAGYYLFPKDTQTSTIKISSLIKKLDLPGIAYFSISLLGFLYFLLELFSEGYLKYIVMFVAILCFFLFMKRELVAPIPFIDVKLLAKNKKLLSIYIQFILLNLFNYCLFFGLPTYFQDELNLDVKISGILMLFLSGSGILISIYTGIWVDRKGSLKPILSSSIFLMISAICLTLFFNTSSFIVICLLLVLLGIGYGIGNVAMQVAMVEATPKEKVGISAGIFQTCRYLGSILSSAVLGIIFRDDLTVNNFRNLGTVLIGIGIVSLLLVLRYKSFTTRVTNHT